MVNANYTWFKCENCGTINRVLPGEVFENIEAFVKVLKCECVKIERPKKTIEKESKEKTIRELREEAKTLGINGYSKMNKDDLQKVVKNAT